MGYVDRDRPDIFVSYAHIDDQSDVDCGVKQWITRLISDLERLLIRRLSQPYAPPGDVVIERRAEDRSGADVAPRAKLSDGCVALIVLSPGYLHSSQCIAALADLGPLRGGTSRVRVFVVETDKIPEGMRPPELDDLPGYQFWTEDAHHRYIRATDRLYFRAIDELASSVAYELALQREEKEAPERERRSKEAREQERKWEESDEGRAWKEEREEAAAQRRKLVGALDRGEVEADLTREPPAAGQDDRPAGASGKNAVPPAVAAPASASGRSPRVFISYRRSDSDDATGRLHDHLGSV